MDQQRRTTRTRGYLVDALVDLLGEKSIYKVQVRELCQRAQMNRSTFYKHYENVEAFVEAVVEGFLEEMDANFGGANIFDGLMGSDAGATYVRCVSFMADRAPFVRAMIGPNGTPLLRERIMAHWTRMFEEAAARRGPGATGRVEPDILATYVVSVMWALLEYTLLVEEKYAPEYLAAQFSYLLHDCTLAQLGRADCPAFE